MGHSNLEEDYRHCPRCGGTIEWRTLKPNQPFRLVCVDCAFVLYLDPKLAACTIFLAEGKIVMLRRAIEPQRGRWVLPGGYVDRGEPVPDAALRETYEETGVRVRITGILDVYSFSGHDVVVVVYAAELVDGVPRALDESEELGLFSPEELPWDELAFDSTRLALRDYLHRFFPRVRAPR